jgi:hypothetical protein
VSEKQIKRFRRAVRERMYASFDGQAIMAEFHVKRVRTLARALSRPWRVPLASKSIGPAAVTRRSDAEGVERMQRRLARREFTGTVAVVDAAAQRVVIIGPTESTYTPKAPPKGVRHVHLRGSTSESMRWLLPAPCSRCDAQPGEDCITEKGNPSKPHAARIDAAKAMGLSA